MIELHHVSFAYEDASGGRFPALCDVSLAVRAGEGLAVVGASGSGKSTLAQHLNGLLRPGSGRVVVDGVDLWAARGRVRGARVLRDVRRRVGLVFQCPEEQFFEETVAAEVAFGPRNLGCSAPQIAARTAGALVAVGLGPEFRNRSPFGLSGGEARRLALAGVLAMDPQYLVLDEPTAGLDGGGREDVLALLGRMTASGLGLVMVTHDVEAAVRVCGRMAVLHHGSVAACAPTGEVLGRGAVRLAAWGLEAPPAVRVLDALRRRGVSLPAAAAVTLEEARDAILGALGGASA